MVVVVTGITAAVEEDTITPIHHLHLLKSMDMVGTVITGHAPLGHALHAHHAHPTAHPIGSHSIDLKDGGV